MCDYCDYCDHCNPYSRNLSNLPRDLQFELGKYLNVRDSLKISPIFHIYYNSFATKVQQWYKKYKQIRKIKYNILYDIYEKDKSLVDSTFYTHMYLSMYNLRRYDQLLNKMYGVVQYFVDTQPENIQRTKHLKLLEYTLENKSYTNYKKFFTKVKKISHNNNYDE